MSKLSMLLLRAPALTEQCQPYSDSHRRSALYFI